MPLNEPVSVKFGKDGDSDLDTFVYNNVTALINSYSNLHENKLPKWRRLTRGKPKEETRNFPWPNASNVVVQLIGENVSTIKAVQLGTTYEILPLWVAGLVGDFAPEEKGEEQRSSVERFLDQMGLSRDELDLYRVESKAAHDIAALGSVVIKLPWETKVQQIVTGIDSTTGKLSEDDYTVYDGPRPEKLAYEDWAATPTAQTWEDAPFKFHKYSIPKHICEKKVFQGHFDKESWDKIKGSPDLTGMTTEESKRLQDNNLDDPMPHKDLNRWTFYECWLTYWNGTKEYSIIYTLHYEPKLRMNAVFNFYPKNEEPFEFGRLGYDEDGLIGYGFAEMGEMYQEEVSTIHNQRGDNRTLANTSVLFAGTNPRIDAGISLFPMATLPFNPDEAEIKQLGTNYPSSVQEEEMTLALAKARFGTDMSSAEGSGSGTVNKKGGYSSMGTFSIMQQGARRINVNITDFRYMHLNIGRKSLIQYSEFGVGENRLKYLGAQGKYLRMAMESIKSGRLELPIKAATASINKEIEKQTGMLFTQVMQRHYGTIGQLLQGVTNPTIPPEIKKFLIGSISGMSYIMGKLLRAFGYDDITRMQPELKVLEEIEAKGANNNGQSGIPTSQGPPQSSNGGQGVPQTEGTPPDSGAIPQPSLI